MILPVIFIIKAIEEKGKKRKCVEVRGFELAYKIDKKTIILCALVNQRNTILAFLTLLM